MYGSSTFLRRPLRRLQNVTLKLARSIAAADHSSDCIKWVKVNSGSMESTAGLPLIVGHEMMGENPPDNGKPSCFGPTGHLKECEMSYEQICVTLDGTKDGHRNGPWATGVDVGKERELGPVRKLQQETAFSYRHLDA
eukprot:COSAG02_NODE_1131_length_14392_cov_8.946061_2_plen_138_part_00